MRAVVVSTEEALLPPTVTVRGAGSVALPFCQEKASEFTESGGAAVPVIERTSLENMFPAQSGARALPQNSMSTARTGRSDSS